MDWVTRMNRAMAYIEEHLEDEVQWAALGRIALCTGTLFARMFAMMTGMGLSDYVRMRRLSAAAQDLQQRGDKVLDVALRYGYASPTAFQRAFVQYHGVTPSQAHKPGTVLKVCAPMSFRISVKGGIAMQYRIEEKQGFCVVGKQESVSMQDGQNFIRIPAMWDEMPAEQYGVLEKEYANGQFPGMFGIIDMCYTDTLEYTIAVSSDKKELVDWVTAIDIPAATYAVFETPFAVIQDTTRMIFGDWLPNSGYEHAMAPELEYYPAGDMSDGNKYICEIWVPVVKKG